MISYMHDPLQSDKKVKDAELIYLNIEETKFVLFSIMLQRNLNGNSIENTIVLSYI